MSACTALMSFTTGVAVNSDENQKDETAHQIYIWTFVVIGEYLDIVTSKSD